MYIPVTIPEWLCSERLYIVSEILTKDRIEYSIQKINRKWREVLLNIVCNVLLKRQFIIEYILHKCDSPMASYYCKGSIIGLLSSSPNF